MIINKRNILLKLLIFILIWNLNNLAFANQTEYTATLIAVGDVLMHKPLIKAGYNNGTYDYDNFFRSVKETLKTGDWTIANLEGPITKDPNLFHGYPKFYMPYQIIKSLKNCGFNILNFANNHTLDQNEKGVLETLSIVKDHNIFIVGSAKNEKNSKKINIIKKNNISIAFLGYTYSSNQYIPKDKYLLNIIDTNKIISDIKRAKKLNADIVTINLHFGEEYKTIPNKFQKRLVKKLAEAGADIILGTHPHVIQPYAIIKSKINNKDHLCFVAYSLGNFISNQRDENTDCGVILSITLKKSLKNNITKILQIKSIPTWVHKFKQKGKFDYSILEISEILKSNNFPKNLKFYLSEIKQNLEIMDQKCNYILNKDF
ncbi:MAG: CapA family protein [Bacteroidetes bacterium]|nr:CapA family protein [Bacteroidota bacterium]